MHVSLASATAILDLGPLTPRAQFGPRRINVREHRHPPSAAQKCARLLNFHRRRSWPPSRPSVAAQSFHPSIRRVAAPVSIHFPKSNVPAAACAVISPRDKPAAASIGKFPAISRKHREAGDSVNKKAPADNSRSWLVPRLVPFQVTSVSLRARIASAEGEHLRPRQEIRPPDPFPIPTVCAPCPAKSSPDFFFCHWRVVNAPR